MRLARALRLADGPPRTPDTAGMGEVCHPYEPGFAQCVGVPAATRWNPYGPGLPTQAPPSLPLTGPVWAPETVTQALALQVDDEYAVTPAVPMPVPEPSAVALLLVAIVLCAPRAWRHHR